MNTLFNPKYSFIVEPASRVLENIVWAFELENKYINGDDPCFTTMEMYVDSIRVFAWIRRYAESISLSLIRMHCYGHLRHMAAIIWSILSRKNP